jgi:hypothetical protein
MTRSLTDELEIVRKEVIVAYLRRKYLRILSERLVPGPRFELWLLQDETIIP